MAKWRHQLFPVFAVGHIQVSRKTQSFDLRALICKFQALPLAISWAQLPVAEPAAATEDQPVRLIVASTPGPRAKHAPFSVCFYPFAYSSNSSPLVNKAARWVRNWQGIYHVQFCFYVAITTILRATITTILRATALEGREHLASLRFTHTVPVSC